MIYQLTKTTPYLGGQVRLDLVADRLSGDSSIVLDEIHVVPLSDRVYYSGSENQLNNRHSDNIAELYKATQDTFFKCIGDRMLEGKYPYFQPDGHPVDTVDHTYQMGLRRIPVSRYSKNLSFLLPMWIDEPEKIDDLEFFVHVYTPLVEKKDPETEETTYEERELTAKRFTMSDRLRKYLRDYMEGVTSDLMYVGLRDYSAYITGLEVSSGTVLTKDVSSLIPNLTDREKPLMEVDNLLVRQFSENQMIARQLLNFNLCFSIEDLFSAVVEPTMHWTKLNIWCEAKLRTEGGREPFAEIPLKDIYSNYTKIYPYKISTDPLEPGKFVEKYTDPETGEEVGLDVLDYLYDTKCIDLMHTNKMLQPNFHWAFADNDRYTWNLYNGFSPVIDKDGKIVRVEGRFFSTPDVTSENYSPEANNIRWMRFLDGTDEVFPGSFVGMSMNASNTTDFSPNEFGSCWSEGIKYDLGSLFAKNRESNGEYSIESSGIHANMAILKDIAGDNLMSTRIYAAVMRKNERSGGSKKKNDYVSIVYVTANGELTGEDPYPHLDQMTILGLRKLLSRRPELASQPEKDDVFQLLDTQTDDNIEAAELFVLWDDTRDLNPVTGTPSDAEKLLRLFAYILDCVQYPNVVRFSKTLSIGLAPSPSIDHLIDNGTMDVRYTDEIEYYKKDLNYSTYLMRYDGNIVPQFIDPELPEPEEEDYWSLLDSGMFNYTWKKTLFSDLDTNQRDCLNYLSRQKFSPDYPSIDYYYSEKEEVHLDQPMLPDGYLGEVCWYRRNLMYYAELEFSIEEDNLSADEMTEEKCFEMFSEYVSGKGWFKTSDDAQEIIRIVLWPMYTHHSDWEYQSETDIEKYRFTVTYTLK